jgi:hypothetical protein
MEEVRKQLWGGSQYSTLRQTQWGNGHKQTWSKPEDEESVKQGIFF